MTDDQGGDDRRQALMLLSQHGLSPNPEELEVLVAAYPVFRLLAAASYAVPGVRDAEPATTFAPRDQSAPEHEDRPAVRFGFSVVKLASQARA